MYGKIFDSVMITLRQRSGIIYGMGYGKNILLLDYRTMNYV